MLDVYHYRWRFTIQEQGQMAWNGLKTQDTWQDKYFKPAMAKQRAFNF